MLLSSIDHNNIALFLHSSLREQKRREWIAMHASGGKRRATTRNNGVAAGSVWDTRIRMDEVEGGVKFYNGDSSSKGARDEEGGIRVYRRLRRNQSENSIAVAAATTTERRKRRNWKPPGPMANDQLRKSISDLLGNAEEEEEDDEGESRSFDDKEIDVAIEKKPIIAVAEKEKEKQKKIHASVDDHKKNKETEITMAAASSRPTLSENYVADDMKNKETEIPMAATSSKPTLSENYVADHKKNKETEIPMAVASSKPTLSENYVADGNSSGISGAQTRIHNIVDLVMWRDVSRSAFVFGFGGFLLVSSSYATDLNFSLISAMSYLGLVYLAMMFLYKSILRRNSGSREFDARAERCMIGEEEAIWVLRFLLPYINEVLLKIRALFSGDPATTMKLACLLFVLARWGGSISTWTMVKLVFLGVFTIPKLSSSYYVQLAKYGKFWLERFQDGWESCNHKKALAAAVFTLVWNISSTIARIWEVFMLVVAVKLYQQHVQEEQWSNNNGTDQQAVTVEEEDCREEEEDSKNASRSLQHRQRVTGPRAVL